MKHISRCFDCVKLGGVEISGGWNTVEAQGEVSLGCEQQTVEMMRRAFRRSHSKRCLDTPLHRKNIHVAPFLYVYLVHT